MYITIMLSGVTTLKLIPETPQLDHLAPALAFKARIMFNGSVAVFLFQSLVFKKCSIKHCCSEAFKAHSMGCNARD